MENKEKKQDQRTKNINGWRAIIGGTLLHLSLGNCYMWGGISLYIASYLRLVDSRTTFSFLTNVYPIFIILINSSYSFGLVIAKKIGFKNLMTSMVTVIFIGVFCLSFVNDVYGFVVLYIFSVCIPSGLLYLLPINIGWMCFPNNRGRVSGFIVAGYGLAAFIFNFVAKAIVNPDNLKPTIEVDEDGTIVKFYAEHVAKNVPKMFQILAACWVVMGYLAIAIIKVPKEMMKKDPNLKTTHMELHLHHNDDIKSETNIRFHNKHTYSNNLYFGLGGLFKSRSSENIGGIMTTYTSPTSDRIGLKQIELDTLDSKNKGKKDQKTSSPSPNRPITLKPKGIDDLHKMIPFHDEHHDEHETHLENEKDLHIENLTQEKSTDCESTRQGILSFPFMCISLIAVSYAFFGQFMLNQYKTYGLTKPELADDAYLTVVGSLASVGNGCSRTIWALIYDRVGFKKVFLVANVVQYITIRKRCGPAIYGVVCFFFGFSNIIAFIVKITQLDTDSCFWVAFGLTAFAFVLACFIKDEYFWIVRSKTHEVIHAGHPISI